jgi:NADH-quinone oxidoreductase subunit G
VLCDRCTRFAREVAGDPLIHFMERGNQTQVLTFPDEPFSSHFSGNTVQICPVGALTATPYRFKARPWDLQQQESTCTSCSVGCRTTVESSRNQLLRYQGVDVDAVNWGWMCDRGRFEFEALNHPDRLGSPLLRTGDRATGRLEQATWSAALRAAAFAIEEARREGGPGSVAVLGGARGTNEDAYAWAKLAKGVIGTDNVDAQLGDGLDPELVLGLPQATIDDACKATTVLLLGPDTKDELPVLFLRLRHAVRSGGTKLVELGPLASDLTGFASVSLRSRPGELAALVRAVLGTGPGPAVGVEEDDLARARAQLGSGSLVVVMGRASLAESADYAADAAAAILDVHPAARFLPALRRGNVRGALELGLAPGLLPGRVTLEHGAERFRGAWPALPDAKGLDATGILTAAAEGRIGCLVLLGADPLSDFPDRDLAGRALAGARRIVAVDTFLNGSSRQADVVLAAAGYAEKHGTTTNLEGRVSRVAQQVTAVGTSRADWMVAAELARHLGADLGVESVEAIQDEMAALAPAFAGLDAAVAAGDRLHDGVLLPVPRPAAAPADGIDADDAGAAEVPPPGDDTALGGDVDVADPRIAAAGATGAGMEADQREADATAPRIADEPPLVRFAGRADAAPLPPVDAYSLRLVSSRHLYDDATGVQHAPHLAPLAPGASVHLHPYDFDRLGVAEGDTVAVTSARATLHLPVRRDARIARGVAWVPFNQPDAAASALIDATAPVTDVRVESA